MSQNCECRVDNDTQSRVQKELMEELSCDVLTFTGQSFYYLIVCVLSGLKATSAEAQERIKCVYLKPDYIEK